MLIQHLRVERTLKQLNQQGHQKLYRCRILFLDMHWMSTWDSEASSNSDQSGPEAEESKDIRDTKQSKDRDKDSDRSEYGKFSEVCEGKTTLVS